MGLRRIIPSTSSPIGLIAIGNMGGGGRIGPRCYKFTILVIFVYILYKLENMTPQLDFKKGGPGVKGVNPLPSTDGGGGGMGGGSPLLLPHNSQITYSPPPHPYGPFKIESLKLMII